MRTASELALGITQRNGEVRKRELEEAPSGKVRGRPKKAPEELSEKYRPKLEGEERVKERRLRG